MFKLKYLLQQNVHCHKSPSKILPLSLNILMPLFLQCLFYSNKFLNLNILIFSNHCLSTYLSNLLIYLHAHICLLIFKKANMSKKCQVSLPAECRLLIMVASLQFWLQVHVLHKMLQRQRKVTQLSCAHHEERSSRNALVRMPEHPFLWPCS